MGQLSLKLTNFATEPSLRISVFLILVKAKGLSTKPVDNPVFNWSFFLLTALPVWS